MRARCAATKRAWLTTEEPTRASMATRVREENMVIGFWKERRWWRLPGVNVGEQRGKGKGG